MASVESSFVNFLFSPLYKFHYFPIQTIKPPLHLAPCFSLMGFLLWALFLISLLSISSRGDDTTSQTFIIRIQNDFKPSAFSDVEHWYSTTLKSLTSATTLSSEITQTHQFLHVYRTVFHGFSTKLTKQQAEEIKTRPEVLGVYPDRVHQIQTTRSPQFLGLTTDLSNPKGLLTDSDSGSNVVIGILDTGIWPERRSFHDQGLGPIPSHWKGECVEAKGFPKTLCNKKLVGARFFPNGYMAQSGGMNESIEFNSPRDRDGHGTHTASTAAGRHVREASVLGFANGVAAGIAPKARIAVYKCCWKRGCYDSDVIAAFDKAIEDGVDVISLSIGAGAVPYYLDPIAISAFGAMEKGVLISASAGNEGPGPMTVTNIAPWITTVGAGTIDRSFPADLVLEDGRVITGASLYNGNPLPEKTFFPLVYARNLSALIKGSNGTRHRVSSFFSALCMPKSLDQELARGKIVLCERGASPRGSKGVVVKDAGGVGVIVANRSPDGEGLVADAHLLPGLSITESAGYTIQEYIATSPNPRATIRFRGTHVGVKPAPVVAAFSSRGPSMESSYIIKPDLIAPGVNILAAWPDGVGPTGISSDTRRTEFNILSGTSMSCPHVSGLAALLKGAHPDWSPAKIKSALMTTAYMHDDTGKMLLDESSYNRTIVWDMGSGHVDPEKSVDPGLVYDLTVDDYLDFLCASNYTRHELRSIAHRPVNCTGKVKRGLKPWNLNYPSISVSFIQYRSEPLKYKAEVIRTATYVGDGASSFVVKIENPYGAIVTVNPPRLEFNQKDEKKAYVVKIQAERIEVALGNSRSEFGRMTWTDGKRVVKMPIGVTWQQSFI